MLSSSSCQYSQPSLGCHWVTTLTGCWLGYNGYVMSAYWHPTKKHTVTTIGKLGVKHSIAN